MNAMLKLSYYRSLTNASKNSLISFLLTATLILLITLNLSWLLILVKLSSRLTTIKNIIKILFNLESLLLLGNFSLIILSIGFVCGTQKISCFKKNCN